jgi:ABC-type transporter MlaC component
MTADEKERLVFTFGVKKIERFFDAVGEQLADMHHGLLTEYENGKIFLVSPAHACPEKEALTRVRVPFRPGDYIPEL